MSNKNNNNITTKSTDNTVIDLEEILISQKRPYRHKSTGEIRYMNLYERYSYLHPEHHDVMQNWEEIQDSKTLRILYFK